MAIRINSSGTLGVDGFRVEVEVDVSRGAFGYETVGLPDAAVRESRQRVKAAIVNARLEFPRERVVVNLSPADVRKEGTAYDLPIAMGILVGSGQVKPARLRDAMFIGELGLSGELRPVRGLISMLLAARDQGVVEAVVPAANAREAASVPGLDAYAVSTLLEAVGLVSGARPGEPLTRDEGSDARFASPPDVDLAHIRGQPEARRGVEVAAAGGHPILLSGPPGTGKTLLARALHGLLPPLQEEERVEVSRVHSVAGLLHGGLVSARPFRAPHHTASAAAVIGGGSLVIRPGEVSLAHRGVLFLDELPEFSRSVREVLRQPMESGEVLLSRATASVRLPACFQLVATMNPCPCGYFGWSGTARLCRCSGAMVERYSERVSGPLVDRFDLQVVCPPVSRDELLGEARGEPSSVVAERVRGARLLQEQRYAGQAIRCNADLTGATVEDVCALGPEPRRLAGRALETGLLSARGYHRALRVARTIADLAGEARVGAPHLAEALRFRNLRAN